MPSIDERVVAMAFENQVFETRVAQTISTLGKLDTAIKNMSGAKGLEDIEKSANKVTLNAPMSALDKLRAKLSRSGDGAAQGFSDIEKASSKVTLEGTGKAIDKTQAKLDQLGAGSAFTDIEKAANQVELSGISKTIQNVSGQFSILSGAAAVAFGNIASQAAMRGMNFAKGFGIGPIIDGLREYETNLKSIQTIQANTDRPLTEINKSLDELNHYSDQTIYNFSEMAKNIGTFTAAGVDLKTATSSIKGIANMAALSGSSSQQAATAMYQLSQAISSGRVGLQDWNSVVNAGMGGKKLQNALAQTSIAMGEIGKQSVKLEGPMKKLTINGQSFRESIMAKPGQQSWLSSEVLVNTLATLDGRFSRAALSAELTKDGLKKYTAAQVEAAIADNRAALEKKNGVKYTDAQFESLMKLSDSAFKSATEVKTLGQVFDVAKETIASGWSASFRQIFGNLTEAKETFTGLSNTINGFINANALARNTILHDWKELGGRAALIEGITEIFKNLISWIYPIKEAFRDIFPAMTGRKLFELTQNFVKLAQALNTSDVFAERNRRIFRAVFATLRTGLEIIKGVVGVVLDLAGVLGQSSGGFHEFLASIGDFVFGINTALTEGGLLKAFFETLSNILKSPVQMLVAISKAIFGLFSGADPEKAQGLGDAMSTISEKVKPMKDVLEGASKAWDNFMSVLEDVGQLVSPWFTKIAEEIANLGHILADAIRNADFDMVFSALNTTFLGGLFLVIKKALGGGLAEQFGGGLLQSIGESFGALTGHLQAMQKNVQASMILKIAGAIAILAAGVFVLSKIPADKLAQAMSAIAVGLGQLVAVMAIMAKLGTGFVGIAATASGMLILSGAVLVLAGALKIMSTIDAKQMAVALGGMAGALAAVGAGMKLLPPHMFVMGAGLVAVGLALNIIAQAVKQFASMNWEEMGRGLAGVAMAIGAIGVGMMLMPPTMVASGLGLIAMSVGMTLLAAAVTAFGALDVKTIAKGTIGLALAVTAMSVAIMGFPPTLALQAGGLVILAAALSGIAGAIGVMGSLGIGKLIKGLTAMGAALGILSVGLYLMIGSAPGAVALIAAAGAFAVLGPAIALLGNLDWGTILKGLVAIAATLGTLAIAGAIAAVPLTLLGSALALVGLGLLPIAASVYILAKALSLLGSEGAKGVGVMVAALTAFVALLPTIVIDFIKGLVGIIAAIAQVAPKVVESLGIIIGSALAAISLAIPKLEAVAQQLFGAFVRIIQAQSRPVIAAGIKLLLDFMGGVSRNISRVVQTASDIVVKFLNGLTSNAPRLTSAGLGTMMAFLGGISTGIPRIVGKVSEMVGKFLSTVTQNLPGLVTKGAEMVVKFINGVTSKLGDIIAAGARFIGQFLIGIGRAIPELVEKGLFVARKFMNGIADGMVGLAHIGFSALIRFLNGLEREIRQNSKILIDAGRGVGDAIFDGVAMAIDEAAGPIIDKLKWVFSKLPGPVKKVLGIKSPSSVFAEIGKNTVEGFSVGVLAHRTRADTAVAEVGKSSMRTLSKTVVTHGVGPEARFREVGQRSMQGLQKGLKESEPAIRATGGGILGGLIGTMKAMLKIRSPSQVMRDIGKNVGEGFKQGLLGSKDDIRAAFKDLNQRLKDEMRTQREAIREENRKLEDLEEQFAEKRAELRELRKHPRKNAEEIAAVKKEMEDLQDQIRGSERAIDKYEDILRGARGAHVTLTKSLQDEKAKLIGMSKDLETVTTNLEEAQRKLDEITAARADFIRTTTDQYNQLPDEGKLLADALAEAELTAEEIAERRKKKAEEDERKRRIDQVANYKKALEEQIAATRKYQETLQKLRELGLDDATYRKLISRGLEGQEFATQLLTSGAAGIDAINELDSELLAVSTGLAEQTAANLYDAGVQTAQGFVDGLLADKADLEKAMRDLADAMVDQIKAALGIRSPSRVFAELGRQTMSGFVEGIGDSAANVKSAAQTAIDAAKDAFSKISMDGLVDVDPTITPVLDLSKVEKEAQKLGDLTNVTPITAAASYGQASAISKETAASAAEAAKAGGNVTQVEFNQYNTSPESLSDTEIYRQTNNQLSQLRSALGLRPKSSV